jgi:transposase
MTETFKLVKETSTRKYEVSNLGTIRINGHVVNRESICHKFGGKDQDYWYNGAIGGYLHRIVALNFVDNPDPIRNTSVTFIDGDKDNITVNNLRWSNITEINKKSVNVRRTTSLASDPSLFIQPTTDEERLLIEMRTKLRYTPQYIAILTGLGEKYVKETLHSLRKSTNVQRKRAQNKHLVVDSLELFHHPKRQLHIDILNLRCVNKLKYKDIATSLNIPLQTVKNVLRRLRVKEGEERRIISPSKLGRPRKTVETKEVTQHERTLETESRKWLYLFPTNEIEMKTIHLRKNLGYSYGEIAAELGIPFPKVNNILKSFRVAK